MTQIPDNNAILISNPTNIRYLTGFVGVESRDAYLLLLSDKAVLFVSPLYEIEAKKVQLEHSFLQKHFPTITKLELRILSANNRIAKQLFTVCTDEDVDALSYEADNLTVAEYSAFKNILSPITLTQSKNGIEILRMKKFSNEIASITAAANLTDECFTFIQTKIKKGVTESALAWEIESFFRKSGAQLAFSPIVAFGPNSALPHYVPIGQGRTLSENEIILLDFGARVDGYCADMTRMLFVGKPKDEWLFAYRNVLLANERTIGMLANGERNGSALDRKSRDLITEAKLPEYPHSLGHGVGLDIHEAPRLTIHQDAKIMPRMMVTIEPGVYIENEFGIRIEDLVYVKETGIDVLSKSTKDVIIL
jgi:Xaa-Pro aminopeptidase